MATVHKTAELPVSAATAWSRIAAIDQVHQILPAISTCTLDGDRRQCRFSDGGVLQERILAVDHDLMRLAYAIVESPFAMDFHAASMQITEEAAGCRITWISDLKPDRRKTDLDGLYNDLFAQLIERLSAA